MPAYVPTSVAVYTAAYTGALAGMTETFGTPSQRNIAGRYNSLAAVAGPFAEQFDTQWTAGAFGTVTSLDTSIISSICEAAWGQRAPLRNYASSSAQYVQLVTALVQVCKSARAYFTAQAITPIVIPSAADLAAVLVSANGYTDAEVAAALVAAAATSAADAAAALAAANTYTDGQLGDIGSYRGTALDANHIHAWEMNDAAGSVSFADTGSSAQKVPLVINTTASIRLAAAGLFGPCPYFGMLSTGLAGAGGYADALISAFNDLPNQASAQGGVQTIECWAQRNDPNTNILMPFCCKLNAGAQNMSVGVGGSGNSYAWTIFATVWTLGGANGASTPATMTTLSLFGQWQYIALTDDGSNIRLFINGELVFIDNSASGGIAWANGAAPTMRVGSDTNGAAASWIGRLSRFRISNVVRSQAYLREVYQQGMLLAA